MASKAYILDSVEARNGLAFRDELLFIQKLKTSLVNGSSTFLEFVEWLGCEGLFSRTPLVFCFFRVWLPFCISLVAFLGAFLIHILVLLLVKN